MKQFFFQKFYLVLFLFFLLHFITVSVTLASISSSTLPEIPEIHINIWDLIDKFTNWFFGITILISSIMIIYAGYTYVTAGGDPKKVQIANKSLLYVLLGVTLAILAKGIPFAIQALFFGDSQSSQNETVISQNTNSFNQQSFDSLDTDFSQITGGQVPNPSCPLDNPSCTCHYDPQASGDVFPCGQTSRGGGEGAQVLL